MSFDKLYIGDPGRSAVFQFGLTNGSWKATGSIDAPEGVDGFGYALALNQETLVIGAYARIAKEKGSVYAHDGTNDLRLIATSNDEHIVGFEVAAEADRIAYARRRRNDPERQTGDVVVRSNGSETIYGSEAYPDYFGMRIDLDRDRLLAMAPAFGDRGGVFLFDLQNGSVLQLALPDEAGRASLQHPVAFVGDACLMAGAGNAAHTQSVAWRRCTAGEVEIIDGTGEVSASTGRIAFSDNLAFPQFRFEGPFAVTVYDLDRLGSAPIRFSDDLIERSVRRNVALVGNRLAIALVDADGVPKIEIHHLE